MAERPIDERLRLLQQQIDSLAETIEAFRLDFRAERDALRLEIEAVWHCLRLAHPEFAERFAAVRTEVIQETDPEAS